MESSRRPATFADDAPPPAPAAPRGWRLARAARETWTAWRAGWREVPPAARRRWLWTVLIGYALLVATIVVVASLGRIYVGSGPLPGEPAFDLALLRALHLKFNAAIWLQTPGTDIPLVMVLVATVGPLARRGRSMEALSVLAAYVLVYSAVNLAWVIWARQRPTIIAAGIGAPGFSSFPSGHTAKAFATYGMLAYVWARGTASVSERVVSFAFALLVGFVVAIGRLGMGAHWPSDVAGGTVFGILMLLVMIAAMRAADRATAQAAAPGRERG